MSDNPYKRAIANKALTILNAGKTGQSGILFTSITDAEFADFTTVSQANYPDKRLICFLYEDVLKQVLEDIMPDFAIRYADLGQALAVNKEYAGYDYLFELPTDYLALKKQTAEGLPVKGFDCQILFFQNYSHVVVGTDDQSYYCSTDHTSVDDSDDGQPPDNDGNSNWTLYSTDGSLGADWAEDVSYENDSTGPMLATNDLTNDDGDSAYIEYIAYVQAGFADMPQYYPSTFKNALATRLAAEMCLDSKDYERRRRLLEEYQGLAKPDAYRLNQFHTSRKKHKTVFESRKG